MQIASSSSHSTSSNSGSDDGRSLNNDMGDKNEEKNQLMTTSKYPDTSGSSHTQLTSHALRKEVEDSLYACRIEEE